MPHLFVDISSHGFGHLAQTAPILNELAERLRGLSLTLRCGLPAEIVRSRIHHRFDLISSASDFGCVMKDATSIDAEKTAEAYRLLHADWERRLDEETAFLASLQPDLALTNVAYLPLAGAKRAKIPAVSMCSLNWADLFGHFFGKRAWAAPIHHQILSAYNDADVFFRITPGMPMKRLTRARSVAPVAILGEDRRAELKERLRCGNNGKIILIAFGGIEKRLPAARWPLSPERRWIIPQSWNIERPDMTPFETLGWNFTDLLRSVDAVLTKPGYGTFAESACNGTATLFLKRNDWPEQKPLIDWLKANARCQEIAPDALREGKFDETLTALWSQTPPRPPRPSGIREITEQLLCLLDPSAEKTPGTHSQSKSKDGSCK
ncbi:MAG: hypothetical protein LBD67_04420 [Candidatus Accumulibacter sp.]|jgi:hypothetical protein|nr:hypothetical protein [Accumulibacter sp.]